MTCRYQAFVFSASDITDKSRSLATVVFDAVSYMALVFSASDITDKSWSLATVVFDAVSISFTSVDSAKTSYI